jgi:hypothetical protein
MDCRAGALTLVSAALAAMMAGCGGGTTKDESARAADDLRKYEETFRPSEFDPPPSVVLRENTGTAKDTAAFTPSLPAGSAEDFVAGFRVQIFSSTDIDEANGIRADAEQRFPGEWFYVVYEPPTYKVRAGDFQERYDADRLARTLREGGFSDSWIVPDRVFKTPPPKARPPAVEDEQK